MAYTFTNLYSPSYPFHNRYDRPELNKLPLFKKRTQEIYSDLPKNTRIPPFCDNVPSCRRVGLEGDMSMYELYEAPSIKTDNNQQTFVIAILLLLFILLLIFLIYKTGKRSL